MPLCLEVINNCRAEDDDDVEDALTICEMLTQGNHEEIVPYLDPRILYQPMEHYSDNESMNQSLRDLAKKLMHIATAPVATNVAAV